MIKPESRLANVLHWIEENESSSVKFRLVEESDAEFILKLRLDDRLNSHVSKVDGDVARQCHWIRSYKEREQSGVEFYFIITLDSFDVGTVRLYDFLENSFCWGSWMITPGTSPRAALGSMDLVYDLAFRKLGFPASHFEVRQDNRRVWGFHEKTGAKLVSESSLERFYVLNAQDYISPLRKRP